MASVYRFIDLPKEEISLIAKQSTGFAAGLDLPFSVHVSCHSEFRGRNTTQSLNSNVSDEMLKIVDKFVLQWKELEHTAGVFVGAIGSGRHSVSQPSVQSITQHHQQERMLQQHFADEVQAMKQGQLQQPAGETEGRTSSQLQTYRSSLTALLRQAHALYHQTSPAGIRAQGGQLPSGKQLISPLQPQTSIV